MIEVFFSYVMSVSVSTHVCCCCCAAMVAGVVLLVLNTPRMTVLARIARRPVGRVLCGVFRFALL